MSLIVQKFGGSSLATPERLRAVASRIAADRADGARLAVVVSAMGDGTDELIDRARRIAPTVAGARERDQLLATGEQAAASLLALALMERGVPAISLTGDQAGIRTDGRHGSARIRRIGTGRLVRAMAGGQVPVVAGFQGTGPDRSICTLGRGGSDTTAVALAIALAAERCDIFTDVPGVFTADPRLVPAALVHRTLTHHQAVLLALGGAVVLHPRAASLAGTHRMPLRILSSRDGESRPGTNIHGDTEMEDPLVLGVTIDRDVVQLEVIVGSGTRIGAAGVLSALTAAGLQVRSLGRVDDGVAECFHLCVSGADADLAGNRASLALGGAATIRQRPPLSSVTIVGTRLAGSALPDLALRALARAGIAVESVGLTDLGISVTLDADRAGAALCLLHEAMMPVMAAGFVAGNTPAPEARPAPVLQAVGGGR